MREEDAAVVIAAIRLLRGVVAVEAHVANHSVFAARQTVRAELRQQLWEVLK